MHQRPHGRVGALPEAGKEGVSSRRANTTTVQLHSAVFTVNRDSTVATDCAAALGAALFG